MKPERRLARLVTVRDRVGRTRYVAFRIAEGGPLSRGALSGVLPSFAKLTRFDGTFGVVRTTHRDRDELVRVLKSPLRVQAKEVRVETLATSGTLRKAATALPPGSEASKRAPPRQRGKDAAADASGKKPPERG